MQRLILLLLLVPALFACQSGSSERTAATAPATADTPTADESPAPGLNADVQGYAARVIAEFDQIPAERQQALQKIALYIKSQHAAGQPARLTFICTHNSRRSHMAQIWSAAAAVYYGIEGVETYSGGTEATAFNSRAVSALQAAGFVITADEPGDNPVYAVSYAEGRQPLRAYSKKYDAEGNPTANFCAVMTCSEADKNCPTVAGAALRVAIPYEDPRNYDGTDQEAAQYAERMHQIAREMFYLFSQVAG
ncbi:MAG: protein-tyrosine-phosphatase [Bacteroidia bacterium]